MANGLKSFGQSQATDERYPPHFYISRIMAFFARQTIVWHSFIIADWPVEKNAVNHECTHRKPVKGDTEKNNLRFIMSPRKTGQANQQ